MNAVLGNTSEPPDAVLPSQLIFSEPQVTEPRARERFRVIYNHRVYTDQQSSLPRVRKVNIAVSPMRLISVPPRASDTNPTN